MSTALSKFRSTAGMLRAGACKPPPKSHASLHCELVSARGDILGYRQKVGEEQV
jgi:hypothetical protein